MSEYLDSETVQESKGTSRKTLFFGLVGFVIFLFVCGALYLRHLDTPHQSFPIGQTIEIPEGATIADVADLFASKQLVRSGLYLYVLLQYDYDDNFVQAGSYTFPEALTSHAIGEAITLGKFTSSGESVTFPEGFKVRDLQQYLPSLYASENVSNFLEYEGYLFPDTYHIEKDTPIESIIEKMRTNYKDRIAPLREKITASKLTEHEVITLASIVEREANDEESMGLVAGILLNRLKIDMPLQVDATLDYILDKASHELTADDLELDSPYNTYLYKGLPPNPISNPGMVAIHAVLEPTESPYLYYLTDDDGTFHYAKTFDEHKLNKARYLR